MLVRLIEENAEEIFLKQLSAAQKLGDQGRRGIMFCRFSLTREHAGTLTLLPAVTDILADYHGEMFFCDNGDAIITWRGNYTATISALKTSIRRHFADALGTLTDTDFFLFYDSIANAEELRLHFMEKVKTKESSIKEPSIPATHSEPVVEVVPIIPAIFTPAQRRAFKRYNNNRRVRRELEILVVEDQAFSRKLLIGMLEKHYTCHAAENALEAIELYANKAPDIVFLDVELPDINGHELAPLFRSEDKDSFIVMVTANHFARDVDMAKQNKVQGFIAKPYNRQKIQDAIDACLKNKKK